MSREGWQAGKESVMEIEFSSLDDTLARFTLSGATPAFANGFRRAMIGEVPTLAIEDVRIYDNTSAFFDEMLAHRLGLIPIKTDLSTYSTKEKCACGGAGCPGCMVTFTLSVEGPKTVLSSDLIPQDPNATPVYDNIPIVKLCERSETRHRSTCSPQYRQGACQMAADTRMRIQEPSCGIHKRSLRCLHEVRGCMSPYNS